MSLSKVSNVRIAGLAAAVPGESRDVSIDAYHPADEVAKVSQNSGVASRYIASASVCSSDLCYAAAERLLSDLGWSRDSVDLLVFVSQTPDYILPATSCLLQHRLGLSKNCAAFDVNMGCSGYVYGLSVVASMISGSGFKRALLLVGDTISKLVDPTERSVAYLFGDAGSATALEYSDGASPMHFVLGTDGAGAMAIHVNGGGFRQTDKTPVASAGCSLAMDGPEVFNFTLREVGSAAAAVVTAAGWSVETVDLWFMHQANKFMVEYIAKRMRLDSTRVPLFMGEFGNTSCASIPLAISARCGAIPEENRRFVLCGFGVGFSWAAMACDWRDVRISPVIHLGI